MNSVYDVKGLETYLSEFCGFFPVSVLGSESALASVSVDDIRDVVNVSSDEVLDVKVFEDD